jgi:hypothetical protein
LFNTLIITYPKKEKKNDCFILFPFDNHKIGF